jgi:hypothetical protein
LREIKTIALAKDLYTPFMPNALNNNKKKILTLIHPEKINNMFKQQQQQPIRERNTKG